MQQLDYAACIDLICAVVRQARKDAQRLDSDAIWFLREFGASGYVPHKSTPMRVGDAIRHVAAIYQQKQVCR